MRTRRCIPFASFILVAIAGCSSDDSNSTGGTTGQGGLGGATTSGPGTGGMASTASSTASSTAATGGAGGVGGSAGGAPFDFPCSDAHPCVSACDVPTTSPSAGSCVQVGAAGVPCNPVTNDGCDAIALEVCDFDPQNSVFKCWPPPNTQMLCQECPTADFALCGPGLTCEPFHVTNTCSKYCCDDGDCSADSYCHKDADDFPMHPAEAPVGVCLQKYPVTGTGGAGGAGGGGTGGAGGAGGATGGAGGIP